MSADDGNFSPLFKTSSPTPSTDAAAPAADALLSFSAFAAKLLHHHRLRLNDHQAQEVEIKVPHTYLLCIHGARYFKN